MDKPRLWIQLLLGKNLSASQARQVFDLLFRQALKKREAKALLLLLARKGETAEEMAGCVSALRVLEKPVNLGISHLMDTCGTGGDGSGSFNVSTLAAFVIAGAGGKVAKHGNRAISSRCGSSDLMEALGVNLKADRARMVRSIRRFGIGYFHAPFHHPVFSKLQPLRKELKTRTIFNLLGPLVNPLRLKAQLLGVSKREQLALFAQVLQRQKRRALVCHSRDGLDEISTAAATDAVWIEKERKHFIQIDPQRLGFRKESTRAYVGGSPARNHLLALALLKGKLKKGPLYDLVVLNSAAGLWIEGKAKSLKEGIQQAKFSLASGKAYEALKGLRRVSRSER